MQREPSHNIPKTGNAFKEGSKRNRVEKTRYNDQYLAKELFAFARMEVDSGKSHEQITKMGGAVVLVLCCVVLVERCWT